MPWDGRLRRDSGRGVRGSSTALQLPRVPEWLRLRSRDGCAGYLEWRGIRGRGLSYWSYILCVASEETLSDQRNKHLRAGCDNEMRFLPVVGPPLASARPVQY